MNLHHHHHYHHHPIIIIIIIITWLQIFIEALVWLKIEKNQFKSYHKFKAVSSINLFFIFWKESHILFNKFEWSLLIKKEKKLLNYIRLTIQFSRAHDFFLVYGWIGLVIHGIPNRSVIYLPVYLPVELKYYGPMYDWTSKNYEGLLKSQVSLYTRTV